MRRLGVQWRTFSGAISKRIEVRMKSTPGFLPAERRAIGLLAAVYAVRMLGLFMVLPVFFIHGVDLVDASPELLGLAIGIYGLSQALLQIPFGVLSDRYGRKPLLIAGLLIFILGSVVAAFSDSVYGVIFGRFLQGAGAIASVLMAFLSDLTRDEQRTKAMAMVGMTIGMSFALALVLGPLLAAWAGLAGIFWVTAVLAALSLILVSRLPSAVNRKRHRDTMLVTAALGQVVNNGQLMRLNFGIFALHLIMTGLFVAVPKSLLTGFSIAADYHGYFYLAVIFLAFVSMIPLIIYGEKQRQVGRVFKVCTLLLTLVLGLQVLAQEQLLVFTLLLFGFFVAFNYLEATLPSLVSKVAPAGMRGTAMGLYSSSQFFGAFLGGSLGGLVFAEGGVLFVYGLCALIGLVWCLVNVKMPEPPYTTSMVVALSEIDPSRADQISSDLGKIGGVQDVTLVVEDRLAYLKIDRHQLDENQLYNYPLVIRPEG